MEYEQTFRFILILGFSVIVPIGAYHRIKSQATGEKLDRRQEGIFILVTLRPIGMASMVGLVTYMINPALMAWSSVALPNWLRWAGVVLGITGGLLLAVTFRTLGKNLTDTVVTRTAHTLVTKGPYRWVRHPFYFTGRNQDSAYAGYERTAPESLIVGCDTRFIWRLHWQL